MPRIRYLKPEFFTDEDLAELSFQTRLTFEGLWCYADKAGRLEDRPRFLKAMIFPYDDIDMINELETLSKPKCNGRLFIERYEYEGQKFIQIVNWDKHQKPHHTETDSKIPPPNTPLKDKEKIKGMEKQHEASTELSNGIKTVKQRLKSTELYNCPYFQEFWLFYPRKEGKGKAWEAWSKVSPKPNAGMVQKMRSTIDILKCTNQWSRDNGQFIPFPSTWLNQRRWEDEPNGHKKDDSGYVNEFLKDISEGD